MKILLLGHNGYLGSYMYKNLSSDILIKRNVYNNHITYDYVINCIGKPDVEYCETHTDETNYSNWLVIEDIIKYYPTAKIINFSTYYVYDNYGLNNEESITTDKYAYMKQNLNAEKLISNGITFRLGKLFGHSYYQEKKLTEYIINNDNLNLDDIKFNPTSLEQVLQVIKYELRNNKLFGIYNLSNLGYCTAYEYGIFINKELNLNKHIIKIDKINKMFYNYGKFLMDVTKLHKIFPLTDWKIDMIKYLKQ